MPVYVLGHIHYDGMFRCFCLRRKAICKNLVKKCDIIKCFYRTIAHHVHDKNRNFVSDQTLDRFSLSGWLVY